MVVRGPLTAYLHFKLINSLCVFLTNFALGFAIRRVQVNQDGLKTKWYTSASGLCRYVNILGGSTYTLKENAEALVAATREIGLEVSADKTKYMVMS